MNHEEDKILVHALYVSSATETTCAVPFAAQLNPWEKGHRAHQQGRFGKGESSNSGER